MTAEELKIKIAELLPTVTFEEGGEWLNMNIEAKDWLPFAQKLRYDEALFFNYLFCLTCIDWKTHLTIVYHLTSTAHRHNMVVKAKLDRAIGIVSLAYLNRDVRLITSISLFTRNGANSASPDTMKNI